jgi:hypothetical protein
MNLAFRNLFVLIVICMVLLMPVCLYAASSGGYTYNDAVAYSFEDIAHINNSLGMTGDDRAKAVSIGFDFTFYGISYNRLYVSSNGHLDFTQGTENEEYNGNNLGIPQPSNYGGDNDTGWGVNPLVAVFFDDLDPLTSGDVYVATKGTPGVDRRFIVQWEGIPHVDCSFPIDSANNMSMQAVLYEVSDEIKFQYRDVMTNDSTSFCLEVTGGGSATVGLDFNDIVGLEYSANAPLLSNNLAILFSPGLVPSIVPASNSIEFGTVQNGGTASYALKLSNTGGQVLVINSTTQYPLAPFSILDDGCTGSTVLPGDFCVISLAFTPTVDGFNEDALIINSTDPNYPPASPLSIIVNGTGAASVAGPDISVLDASPPDYDLLADMGAVDIFTNAVTSFTVNNNGTSDLNVSSVAAEASPPFFIDAEDCTSAPVAASGSCSIDMGFKAMVNGPYMGELIITSDDPDEALLRAYVSVTANHAFIANIAVADSVEPGGDHAVAFTDTTVGQTSAETVYVTNNGTADLTISSVLLAVPGPYTGFYSISANSCIYPLTLAPGEACSVSVDFTPTSIIDDAAASLSIASDDPDESPVTVTFTGNGLSRAPSAPVLVSPENGAINVSTSLDFHWNPSTDPDPGDTVTYELYYTNEAGYIANGSSFTGVTPIGGLAKAGSAGGTMYASAVLTAPGIFLIAALAFSGPLSRRRKVIALLLVMALMALMLIACGSGLPTMAGTSEYDVTGLDNDTIYYWKVVATDSYGISTDSAHWSFTTKP